MSEWLNHQPALHEYRRFLHEAGDTTFYGNGKIPIVGNEAYLNVLYWVC